MYIYIVPAINKTKQAYGRLIRSEKDKGIIILMDYRYKKEIYGRYLRDEIIESNNIVRCIRKFYER